MKRILKLLCLIIAIMFVFPNSVKAINLNSAKIGKDMTVKTGDTFTIPLSLSFTDNSALDKNAFGIGGVAINLEYDDTIFKFIEASASGFSTELIENNGKYIIASAISGEDLLNNNCADNILYCGEYNVSITFYVKDTNKENASVKINEATIIGWKLENGKRDSYLTKDMSTYTSKVNKEATITIKRATIKDNEPDTITKITTENKNDINIANAVNKKIEQNNLNGNIDNTKSNNNYLSKLEIDGYLIDFYKRTNEYEIELENGKNKLFVTAELEDKSATLEIVGADNIKANNNKIEIIVTAENGTQNTYTINVIYDDDTNKKSLDDINIIKKIKDFFIEYKTYIIIGVLSIILLIIIVMIINKINDNKLGNKFDNL